MKTLNASTPKSGIDPRTQNVSEWPVHAVELTDEDLEGVSGGFFGFGGFSPFGFGFGFRPFGFGFGGFSPFCCGFGGWGGWGGWGSSIAVNSLAIGW